MKAIVTLAMNPAIDKSSSVDHVFPNRNCTARLRIMNRGVGVLMLPGR